MTLWFWVSNEDEADDKSNDGREKRTHRMTDAEAGPVGNSRTTQHGKQTANKQTSCK